MAETEIGLGKAARRGYGFGDIAIVPSRRTRDPQDVDISWEIDAYRFAMPFIASAMDSVTSPASVIEAGRLGALAVLSAEGLWARHADADAALAKITEATADKARTVLRDLYAAPIDPDLLAQRVRDIKDGGAVAAVSVTPGMAAELAPTLTKAELDLLVIQRTVLSAEHVSKHVEPLNLKTFVRNLEVPVLVGGCASQQAALHLMRTGAAGVLVGIGPGQAVTSSSVLGLGAPQATAIADARSARMRHLDETGVYCHVIADGGMANSGDVAKAIVCGADAVMMGTMLSRATESPGAGFNWSNKASHGDLPRGHRSSVGQIGSLEEILVGPAVSDEGQSNLAGALRTSMAACGYTDVKDFQKASLMVLS